MGTMGAHVAGMDPGPEAELRVRREGSLRPTVSSLDQLILDDPANPEVIRRKSSLLMPTALSGGLAGAPVAASISYGKMPTLPEAKLEGQGEGGPEAPPPKEKRKMDLKTAFRYGSKRDRILTVIACICACGQGATQPLNMLFLGDSVNHLGTGSIGSAFQQVVYKFCILAAVGFVLGLIATTILEIVAERQVKAMKIKFIHGILQQEIGYYDLVDPGTLATDIEQSCVKIRDGIGMKLGILFQLASQFVSGYVVGIVKGWQLALVMTAVLPIIAVALTVAVRFIRGSVEKSEKMYANAGSVAEEVFPAMRTVASFGLEEHFDKTFSEKVDQSEAADKIGNHWKSVSFAVVFGILVLSYALGWWYGTRMVVGALRDSGGTDYSQGGTVMTTFSAVLIASFSLGQTMPNLTALATAAESVKKIVNIVERPSQIDPFDEFGERLDRCEGKIEFRHVDFAYPKRPERPIYNKVNFEIKPGETVALVGASGCGKSTVVQLILRYYDPSGGQIFVDGHPISSLNVQWLRQKIALVQQEPRLFATSIRANIACGAINPDAVTDEQVIEAAKQSNAHGFITTFPDGYETDVGAAGSLLSGGQKQRIAIARAILRDPSILILDEATSALDNESERVVQEALTELVRLKKRTTIIIAHRLTTIRQADKIVVLDNPDGFGAVVAECGTHQELVSKSEGIYKRLVEAQETAGPDGETTQKAAQTRQELGRAWSIQRASIEHLSRPGSKIMTDAAAAKILESTAQLEALQEDRKALAPPGGTLRVGSRVSRGASIVSALGMDDTVFTVAKHVHTRRLWKYSAKDWYFLLLGALGSVGTGFVFPIVSILVAKYLGLFFYMNPAMTGDQLSDHVETTANKYSAFMTGWGVLTGLFFFMQNEGWGLAGEGLVATMRREVFGAIIRQDIEFFDYPENNVGFLSSVLAADCVTTKGVTGENLALIFQNFFTLLIAVVVAFTGNAKLAAVVLAAYCLLIPALYFQIKLSMPSRLSSEARLSGNPGFVLNEIVVNIRMICAYGLQKRFESDYEKAIDKEVNRGIRTAFITGVASGLATGLQAASNAIAMWYAGYLMDHEPEGVNIEIIMRTIMVMMNAGSGLGRASAFATDSKKAKEACKNIFGLVDSRPPPDISGDTTRPIHGDIQFENLVFRYPARPNNAVLGGVSFQVKPGQAVALVGASGSGKSTIIQLLERFYDLAPSAAFRLAVRTANEEGAKGETTNPFFTRGISATEMFDGKILLEEKNITLFNKPYLRSRLGLVQQEPVLFTGSVKYNIGLGKQGASEAEIIEACKKANAHDFVTTLPDGYDTDVGKGGGQMSGGQKQRLAIARALIRDPSVLLFDEATSALDPESEKVVQETLDKLVQGAGKKTSITIAHRLSTIRHSDKIVVFVPDPGRGSTVVEQGTHDELMKIPDGVYRHLVDIMQASK